MEEYTLADFENVICLKNQLICVPLETLLDVYNDSENFVTFLDTFCVLANTDSAFMLFSDELADKVGDVIAQNRFKYKDKEIVNAMNEIIGYLNGIKNYDTSYKNLLMNGYLAYQEDCRDIEMEDTQTLLESMAYDAIAYCALKEDKLEMIDLDDMFLASVNYLMIAMPEMFKDEKVKEVLMKKLDELDKKGGFFKNRVTRTYAKDTREKFQKIKAKEE